VGYARRNKLFHESQIPSTSTLYNAVWAGRFALKPIDLPEATKRRHHKRKSRVNKRPKGTSIEHRPAVVDERKEMGHWETDTVVGKREGKEAVVLSLVERVSMNYLSILIPGKTSDAVMGGMKLLRETFGDKFGTVFKTITTDNGPEFETFSQVEDWGTKIYFAHPYSSWERPVNERHNRILRIYMPKGKSMAHCTPEDVLAYSDEMNGLPRRCLDYRTPEEVFEEFLDTVYAA
jgi:IS30 family transposase